MTAGSEMRWAIGPAAQESRLRRTLGGLPRMTSPRQQAGRAREGLSEMMDGGIVSTREGEIFVREFALGHHSEHSRSFARRMIRACSAAGNAEEMPLGRQGAVWFDIETAGWLGRPMFLAGMIRRDGDDLVIKQFFARHWAEERALVAQVCEELRSASALFTFNGKSFDMPFVRDRAAYHRMNPPDCADHVDILHLARRKWRGVLPDCRLQTLERHVCSRYRAGDVPSSEVPLRYHEYIHSGDPALIAPVFRHNMLDLITLVEVSAALAERGGKK